ncbi:MAG: tetratricopeptide repeat protein [Bacteroidales bacterium]
MKQRLILALTVMGCVSSLFAQGYKDGIEYYKAEQLENAKVLLERNIDKAETNKAASYFYLGLIDLEEGDIADAKKNFELSLSDNSELPYAYVGLGYVDLKNGDAKAAEKQFKSATKLAKKDASIRIDIARAYYKVDAALYAEEIAEYIKDAKKKDKSEADIYVFEGDMLADQEKWGDSAGYYEMAIRYEPEAIDAYVKYANTYFYINPAVAIEKLKSLVEANPNSALARRELAEKYYQNDQWTKAAEVYGAYINNPNSFADDKARYAVLLYFGEKYDESYALASEILAANADAFLMRRMLFLNMAAKQEYQKADELAKTFFGIEGEKYSSNDYSTYADVLMELGRVEEAIIQYEKAYELNPEKTDLLKSISSAHSSIKDYENSALAFERYVEAGDPSTNDIYILSGRFQNIIATTTDSIAKDAALEKAIKYVDIVIERVPEDYRIAQRKARILMVFEGEKNMGTAKDAYEAMIEVLDLDAEANLVDNVDAYKEGYNYIASYYVGAKDLENAKVYYEKFLVVDPENQALIDYVATLEKAIKKQGKK